MQALASERVRIAVVGSADQTAMRTRSDASACMFAEFSATARSTRSRGSGFSPAR